MVKALRSWLKIALKVVCETRLQSDSVALPSEFDGVETIMLQRARPSTHRIY
jgi:hypothetical protein